MLTNDDKSIVTEKDISGQLRSTINVSYYATMYGEAIISGQNALDSAVRMIKRSTRAKDGHGKYFIEWQKIEPTIFENLYKFKQSLDLVRHE